MLLWMGRRAARGACAERPPESRTREASPFVAGMLMSAGNPYFLVWWATVGATLVFRAWEFGLWPFVLFAVVALVARPHLVLLALVGLAQGRPHPGDRASSRA